MSFTNPDLDPATNLNYPVVHGIHILTEGNAITKLEVNQFVGGKPNTKMDLTPNHNNWLLRQNDFEPQDGYLHIIPAFSRYMVADSLDVMDGAIELRPTVTNTNNLTAIYHLVERSKL